MNFSTVHAVTMVVGVAAVSLLNGCACDCSKTMVNETNQPALGTAGTQSNAVGSNAPPLAYQWYSTNVNPTAQFSVTATGSPALYYQWYSNTNGQQQFNVGVSSNGAPTYQWYKDTNANEGAH
jgi:hypothetical protein